MNDRHGGAKLSMNSGRFAYGLFGNLRAKSPSTGLASQAKERLNRNPPGPQSTP